MPDFAKGGVFFVQKQRDIQGRCLSKNGSSNNVRIIADLVGSEEINSVHLAEALHASQSSQVDDRTSTSCFMVRMDIAPCVNKFYIPRLSASA